VKKRQQHLLFLSSDHYATFQKEHTGASACYAVWHDVLGKVGDVVGNPGPESCVDEKTDWST